MNLMRKPLVPAINNIAKLVAEIRRLPIIAQKMELPSYRAVISATYNIKNNDLSAISVLDLGQREAAILVSTGMVGQALHIRVRDELVSHGFLIQTERIASVGVIADVNCAIQKSSDVNTNASDVRPLIDEIIVNAVKKTSTDIHICCREKSSKVLFRIHGRIIAQQNLSIIMSEQIAGYLFTEMAEERSRSQGTFSLQAKSLACTIQFKIEQAAYKLRYKFIRAHDGWDVVVRILRVEAAGEKNATFAELGYEASQIKLLEHAVSKPIGLISITGPTGSGKSTTLKAMMEFDPNRRFKKRYSIEDPVEYKIFGVTQISIQRDDHDKDEATDLWAGALRDLLRGDPDDIMIGEVRDTTTAQIMTDFVLTGHKIYTTLHTDSAIGSILRLNRLGVDRDVLSGRTFISALVSQRLLPVICPHCRRKATEVLDEDKLQILQEKFGLNIETLYCSNDDGCEKCSFIGTTGVTVAAEVISFDKHIRNYIAEKKDESAENFYRSSRKTGFANPDMTGKTAFEHALYKMSLGLIDPRDVESVFDPFSTYEIIDAPYCLE